jgi:hypothetical protein
MRFRHPGVGLGAVRRDCGRTELGAGVTKIEVKHSPPIPCLLSVSRFGLFGGLCRQDRPPLGGPVARGVRLRSVVALGSRSGRRSGWWVALRASPVALVRRSRRLVTSATRHPRGSSTPRFLTPAARRPSGSSPQHLAAPAPRRLQHLAAPAPRRLQRRQRRGSGRARAVRSAHPSSKKTAEHSRRATHGASSRRGLSPGRGRDRLQFLACPDGLGAGGVSGASRPT